MNFFNVFEDRIASVFGTSPQGYTEPFSFKKLAKRAAKEMEKETYVINGVDTAPGLYTILVSSADDAVMRPLYGALTNEIAQFVEGQAQTKGYTFVGEPLVRFMVDPSLRSGKFSVFAENVDARTLGRLRAEEISFLESAPDLAEQRAAAARRQAPSPTPRSSARARVPQVTVPPQQPVATPPARQEFASESDAGLDVLPANEVSDPYVLSEHAAPQVQAANRAVPMSNMAAPGAPAAGMPVSAADVPAPSAPAPQTVRRPSQHAQQQAPAQASARPAAPAAACILIDRKTGQTYNVSGPRAIIGRERNRGGVVLRDPNVSRRHAELSHDGRTWRIADLNSTNGTLVNDVDVDECALRNGDLITLGLTNLEFREN